MNVATPQRVGNVRGDEGRRGDRGAPIEGSGRFVPAGSRDSTGPVTDGGAVAQRPTARRRRAGPGPEA